MNKFIFRFGFFFSFFSCILGLEGVFGQASFGIASGSSATGCAPLTVNFTPACPSCNNFVVTNYVSGTLTSSSPQLTFPNAGTFSVTMNYTINGVPGSVTNTNSITVYPNPSISFSTPDTAICVGTQACFTPTVVSGTGPFNYTWLVGQSSSSPNPCLTFNTAGSYTASVTVSDVHGCTNSKSIANYLDVIAPPNAAFTTNYTAACTPPVTATYSWTGTPQNPAYTHSWNFGDLGTSTASGNPSFTHNYTTIGSYDVTHIVSYGACADTVTQAQAVVIGIATAPYVVISDTTPCKDDNITVVGFTAGTYVYTTTAGLIVQSGNSATISCTNVGLQTITTTYTFGPCTQSYVDTIFVDPGPDLMITANNTNGCVAPFPVTFSLTSPSGQALGFSWVNPVGATFAGNIAGGQQYTYTYPTAGNFDVSVLATTTSGCTQLVTNTGFINIAAPNANFSPSQAQPANICKGQSVQFTDLSVPVNNVPITNWSWTFVSPGNPAIPPITGSGPLQQNPLVTFNPTVTPALYTVTLTITDANGCTSTKSYVGCVKVGTHLVFGSPMDFLFTTSSNGTTNICASQTISYAPFFDVIATPQPAPGQLPAGATAFWQYYTPTGVVPAYYSPYTGNASGVTFNPDYLGVFCVKLIVNNNGCKDSVSKCSQFTVSGPVAEFNYSPVVNCKLPQLYTFTDSSFGATGSSILWKIKDASGAIIHTASTTNTTYNFTTAGLYTVTLIRSGSPCNDSITKTINVSNIVADFTPSSFTECAGNTLGFTPAILGGITYAWNFGDPLNQPNTSNVSLPYHTYPVPGVYTSQLIVTGNSGFCNDTVQQVININGANVNILVSDSVGCAPFPPVQLTGVLVNSYPVGTPITTWSWTFSDGSPGQVGQVVTYTATNPGYNYVYLEALAANGCVARDTIRIVVSAPQAQFTADFTTNCTNNPTVFTSSSVGIGGTFLSYVWNFGVGANTAPSTSPTATYSYTANGTYNVSLTITDVYGCTNTLTQPSYITIAPFVANYAVSDSFKNCPTLSVLCTPQSVSGHAIDTTTLQWILYDNPPPASIAYIASQYSPTLQIGVPGVYTLMMIVESVSGCKDTVQKNNLITVLGPKTDIIVSPSAACPGTPITLQAVNGTSDIISYEWLLSGGTSPSLTSQNTTVIYTNPGTYYPIVKVSNGTCTVSMPASDSVVIWTAPIANFTADDTVVCVPGVVNFLDASIPGSVPITAWNWDLGSGTATTQNPTGNYPATNLVPISLTITDANGCKDTLLKPNYINVIQNNQPQAVTIQRVSVDNDNQISVNFDKYNNSLGDFGQYLLYRSDNLGPFNLVASITNINNNTYIDNAVTTNINSYEYQIKVENGCGNISNFSASSKAPTLITTPLSGKVKLDWTPYLGWTSVTKYNIYKVFNYDSTTHVLIGSVSGSTLSYTDSVYIRCTDPISYRVEAIGAVRNAWSDTTTSAPLSAAVSAKVHTKVATVENEAIKITWNNPNNVRYLQSYQVEKDVSNTGTTYVPVGAAIPATSTLEYIDTDVNVKQQPYTYRIVGLDSCGSVLQSGRIGRTMLLTATPVGAMIRLNWTPYSEWQNGLLRYRIQLYNENVPEWVTIDSVSASTLVYEDKQIRFALSKNCYRILAVEKNGNKQISMSNESCGSLEPVIYTPTAFTPNGDGVNDTYIMKGSFIETFHIRIYSNWGQLVFESNDITKGWDGTKDGTAVPEGTYVYVVTITSLSGLKKEKAGSITLIR